MHLNNFHWKYIFICLPEFYTMYTCNDNEGGQASSLVLVWLARNFVSFFDQFPCSHAREEKLFCMDYSKDGVWLNINSWIPPPSPLYVCVCVCVYIIYNSFLQHQYISLNFLFAAKCWFLSPLLELFHLQFH
jgi:hypothetical protein